MYSLLRGLDPDPREGDAAGVRAILVLGLATLPPLGTARSGCGDDAEMRQVGGRLLVLAGLRL